MLLENGVYMARVLDVVLYLRGDHQRLTATFKLACEGLELAHNEWLELNDGTISDKTLKRLRVCFPNWDGTIETMETGEAFRDVECEVTVKNEPDKQDPEKMWTRTNSICAPGQSGAGAAAMPQAADRHELVSRYSSLFRSVGGVKPAAAAARGPARAAAVPPSQRPKAGPGVPPQRPAVKAETSSLAACWAKATSVLPDSSEKEQSDWFWARVEEAVPGKDQEQITPAEWFLVLDLIERKTSGEMPF